MKFQEPVKRLKVWLIQTNDPETPYIFPDIWGSPRSLQAKHQCGINAKGIIGRFFSTERIIIIYFYRIWDN